MNIMYETVNCTDFLVLYFIPLLFSFDGGLRRYDQIKRNRYLTGSYYTKNDLHLDLHANTCLRYIFSYLWFATGLMLSYDVVQ